MKRMIFLCAAAFGPAAGTTPLWAQETDPAFILGDIIVTARAMTGRAALLTSVDLMGADMAQRADGNHIYTLIAQMPGIQLTEFRQGTTSGKFSMRGFNGEGTINAVKLLLDGVPANSNDGNMPYLDMIFPLNVATIEVVRGTADPRYGLHAIAGSAHIFTRTGGTYVDGRVSLGRFDSYEGQAALGLAQGAFAQNYFFAYRHTDGYRPHDSSRAYTMSGKWSYDVSPDVRVQALARAYDGQAQEAGYLTYADSRIRPLPSYDFNRTDGGLRRMQQFGLRLETALSDDLGWTSLVYYNRLRDDRFVKFSSAAAQQRRWSAEDHQGLSSVLHWHGHLANMPMMLEAGGDMEWQDNRSARWVTVERRLGAQTRDQQYDLRLGGAYVQAVLTPFSKLQVTPSYRLDWVGGDFENRLNISRAPINEYGTIRQPKIAVTFMMHEHVRLYGNWGKSFQIGLGSGAYLIAPRRENLAPSMNEGWEAGVLFARGSSLTARLALWGQTATGEIARKLNDPLGDFENVGATQRKGVDVQAKWAPYTSLSLWGALAWQKASIRIPPPANPDTIGHEIDHVPQWLWSGGLDWEAMKHLAFALTVRGQSSYHLTSANSQGRWGHMLVADMQARYHVNEALELGLSVRNIGNDFHEYVWWDGTQSLHSVAAPRTVSASIRIGF